MRKSIIPFNPRLTFIGFVFFFAPHWIAAQPAMQWTKTIGGTLAEGVYSPNCIEETSDHGFIVAAGSGSMDGDVTQPGYGFGDYWIVKFDSLGNITWQKKFGGSLGEAVMAVIPSAFGGYYVAGYSQSTDGYINSNHGFYDIWILKLDNAGDTIWSKTYGGSSSDYCQDILETSDGHLIFAGHSYSDDGDVSLNQGLCDYWVGKIDPLGNLIWENSYGGSAEDEVSSIEQTSDGGYIIAGNTKSNDGDVTGFNGLYDAWIIKIDAVGNLVWQKSYGGSEMEKASKAIPTPGGGFLVVGFAGSVDGFIHTPLGGYDTWLLKLDALGDTIWTKSYGGGEFDFGMDIQSTFDGDFIIGNQSSSNDAMVTGNHGQSDYWIMKIDSNGIIQWQQSRGGNGPEYLQAVRQTADSGYVLIGSTLSSNYGEVAVNHGSYDLLFIKLNSGDPEFTSYTDATCFESCNGTATITVDYGTPPYVISGPFITVSETFISSVLIDSMCAGFLSYTITDALGDSSSITVAITEPQEMEVSATADFNTPSGECLGEVTAWYISGDWIMTMTYEWYNCATWNSLGAGTNMTDLCSGEYAVIMTSESGCVDTSECVEIVEFAGLEDQPEYGFSIYPNPTNGSVTISLSGAIGGSKVEVVNLTGKVILRTEILETCVIDLSDYNLEDGCYFVRVVNNKGVYTKKVVLMR